MVVDRLGLLSLAKLPDMSGKCFIVATNNVVTGAAIYNGKSRTKWIDLGIKILQKLLHHLK